MLLRGSVCACLLLMSPFCLAQVVTIRVINSADGRPLQKQHVSVSLLYDKGEKAPAKYDAAVSLETDAKGEAHFTLPEPAPLHLSAQVRLTSEQWHCGCRVLVATGDVVQKGILGPIADAESKKSAPAAKMAPGDILFVAVLFPFLNDFYTRL
jgi:hypothetical protein